MRNWSPVGKITFCKKTNLDLKQIKVSGINISMNNCGYFSFYLLIQLSNMKLLVDADLIFLYYSIYLFIGPAPGAMPPFVTEINIIDFQKLLSLE